MNYYHLEIAGIGFSLEVPNGVEETMEMEYQHFSLNSRREFSIKTTPSLPPILSKRRNPVHLEFSGSRIKLTKIDHFNLVLCRDAKQGHLAYNPLAGSTEKRVAPQSLRGAIKALWATLFTLTKGIALHASAIDCQGSGVAFLGRDEAGKTTAAHLMGDYPLLNDDFMGVDCTPKGSPILHATPFAFGPHKEPRRPHQVPFHLGCGLHHSTETELTALAQKERMQLLMGCIILPNSPHQVEEDVFKKAVGLTSALDWRTLRFSKTPEAVQKVITQQLGNRTLTPD